MFTLKKNWIYPILRQNFASSSEFHYNLKELLVNSSSGLWTVHSSATETVHGPVDYWTSPAAITTETNFSARPWVTLTFDDSNVRFYMTIEYQNTSGSSFRIFTHHNEVPFGGTSLVEPQSTDKREVAFFSTNTSDVTMSISQDGKHFRVFGAARHLFFGFEDDLPFAGAEKFTYAIDERDLNGFMNFLNNLDKGSDYIRMSRVLQTSGDSTANYGNDAVITQALYFMSDNSSLDRNGILPPDLYSVVTPTPVGDTLSESGVKRLFIIRRNLATPIPSNF